MTSCFHFVLNFRCVFLINPGEGTKVSAKYANGKYKKREAIKSKVATLLKNVNDFEWRSK
jgi:hypothetical protein